MGILRSLRAREERPVNPPFRGTVPTPEPRQPPPRPGAVAVEEPAPAEPAGRSPEPERDAGQRPAPLPGPVDVVQDAEEAPAPPPGPVHVPYARTEVDPDVVSAPPARTAPRPARSPFWAAVRSHVWLVTIVLVVVAAAGTAYYVMRVHQRITAATLQRDIAGREHASAVRCVEQQSNGSVWACGLVYQAASACLIANVNPVGDWNTNEGPGLCDHRPELAAILPDRITASAVVADLAGQGTSVTRCAKVPEHKVRWACVGSPTGGGCLQVRVAPWSSLGTEPSDVCAHVPALRRHGGNA
jgi:hypothetical protein